MPFVRTVLGDIAPEELGRTLTHEHFALDFTHFYRSPPAKLRSHFQHGFELRNVGYLRQYPYSSKYNLKFSDEDTRRAVLADVATYKNNGGGTIVENTTYGLGRDLNLMKDVTKTTGVHVVAGTGYYIADMQKPHSLEATKEQIYEIMIKEVSEGCLDDANVKAGFMGEIASVWPIKDFERRSIVAAGEAQEQLGCGVSFHPHRASAAPAEIMRLYLEAGGAPCKAVMSHLDRTLTDPEQLLHFSDLGCYCQFDLFGVEVSYYQLNEQTDMPSDAQRLDKVKLLVDEKKTDRILLSHDIHTKHRLIEFGGHGYSHIINNILPRMIHKGLTQQDIDQITIHNPATWLSMKSK